MWMMRWGPKNAEMAERILAEQRGTLSETQIAYLEAVVKQGREAQKIVEKYDRSISEEKST